MTAFEISELKDFTSKLFIQNTFDAFLVSQASFTTSISITLDGSLRKDYFTEAEWEEMPQHDLARWSLLKPLCFQIIKGSRLPEQFRIVFVLSRAASETLLRSASIPPEQIGGLFLNIHYEHGALTCVTGVSFASFLMDRTPERIWDDAVRQFLKKQNILFCEL